MKKFENGKRYFRNGLTFEVIRITAKFITFRVLVHAGKENEVVKEESKRVALRQHADTEVFYYADVTVEALDEVVAEPEVAKEDFIVVFTEEGASQANLVKAESKEQAKAFFELLNPKAEVLSVSIDNVGYARRGMPRTEAPDGWEPVEETDLEVVSDVATNCLDEDDMKAYESAMKKLVTNGSVEFVKLHEVIHRGGPVTEVEYEVEVCGHRSLRRELVQDLGTESIGPLTRLRLRCMRYNFFSHLKAHSAPEDMIAINGTLTSTDFTDEAIEKIVNEFAANIGTRIEHMVKAYTIDDDHDYIQFLSQKGGVWFKQEWIVTYSEDADPCYYEVVSKCAVPAEEAEALLNRKNWEQEISDGYLLRECRRPEYIQPMEFYRALDGNLQFFVEIDWLWYLVEFDTSGELEYMHTMCKEYKYVACDKVVSEKECTTIRNSMEHFCQISVCNYRTGKGRIYLGTPAEMQCKLDSIANKTENGKLERSEASSDTLAVYRTTDGSKMYSVWHK